MLKVAATARRIDGNIVYEVSENGVVVASIHGPQAFMAAYAFVDFKRSGKTMADAMDMHYGTEAENA